MTTTPPNIILLTADDLGWTNLGCYGSPDLQTPHIDSLAADGVRFTQFYSAAPVCSPARSAWLTGRHPLRTDTPNIRPKHDDGGLRLDEILLPELMRERGYVSGCMGKWHLGISPAYRPLQRGFDEFYGVLDGMIDYYSYARLWGNVDRGSLHYRNHDPAPSHGEYFTEYVTREACDFIQRHAAQPFFLYLAYTAPHIPMQVPDEYLERFSHLPGESRRVFAAMVACLDDGVGAIRQTLAEQGIADNTIIVFTCDHGWQDDRLSEYATSDPLRPGKFYLYEGGIRVPGIVTWPAQIPGGQQRDQIASGLDLFPTFLQWAGVAPPPDRTFDGHSLDAVIAENAPSPHEALYWFYEDDVVTDVPDGHAAIRRGRWKLVRGTHGDELYDLETDISETHDLASRQPALTAELSAALADWEASTRRQPAS